MLSYLSANNGSIPARAIPDRAFYPCRNRFLFAITLKANDIYALKNDWKVVFAESVKTYFGDCDSFKLVEIKTKNGKTYKAVPIISMKEESENIEE